MRDQEPRDQVIISSGVKHKQQYDTNINQCVYSIIESSSVTKVMQCISFQMMADGSKLFKRKNAAKRNIVV